MQNWQKIKKIFGQPISPRHFQNLKLRFSDIRHYKYSFSYRKVQYLILSTLLDLAHFLSRSMPLYVLFRYGIIKRTLLKL